MAQLEHQMPCDATSINVSTETKTKKMLKCENVNANAECKTTPLQHH